MRLPIRSFAQSLAGARVNAKKSIFVVIVNLFLKPYVAFSQCSAEPKPTFE